jgi:glycosyltransferase involved in cell wall biosynthesis
VQYEKKKLLFVMPSLSAGGGEKSLVNLLTQIDYKLYNVDLFLFNKTGVFIDSIPREVSILDFPTDYENFTNSLRNSTENFIKNGKVYLAYYRLMFSLKNRLIKEKAKAEQNTWKYISKSLGMLDKEYDAAIGFLEKSSIYFVVDKVKSKKKIGWIHTNYSNSGMDKHFDHSYFSQLDHVITVSEECAISLKGNFPQLENKVEVIYNIVSPKLIDELSDKETVDDIIDHNYINIITVARLSHEKGIDLAIQSCRILLNKGHQVKWYVLGDGNEREELESLIENNHLNKNFKLLGIKENPYPYIKKCDIYVQPSRYEGKSIAIDEAKILHKPIIITKYETAKDQITDGIDGLIVDMKVDSLAEGIEKLMFEEEFKNKLTMNLAKEKLGTEEEINKLYQLI